MVARDGELGVKKITLLDEVAGPLRNRLKARSLSAEWFFLIKVKQGAAVSEKRGDG